MQKIELRFNEMKLESTDEGLKVSGYVNKTNKWSETLGSRKKFVERILPGTFRKALQNGNEINFLAEHDNAKILASTRNDSLTLREDEQGLFMEATIAPTSWGKDYHTLIKEGIIQNMSFGMKVLKDTWRKLESGLYERSISDLYLAEVSAVRNPAYVQSTISARSINVIEEPTINITEEKTMSNTLEQYRNKLADMDKTSVEKKTFTTAEQENRGVEQFLKGENGEERAMLQGSGNGAILVPTHVHSEVIKKAHEVAPIFARTRNVTPINGYAEVLREVSIGQAAFIGEEINIVPQDFQVDKVRLEAKRVGTAIELSENIINDSGVDVVNYTKNTMSTRLGKTVENSILFGDKTLGQFEGILKDSVDNTIQQTTIDSLANITADNLLDFYQSVNPEYHDKACWVMSRKAFNKVNRLKSLDGNLHSAKDDVTEKISYNLFGFPVFIHEDMDDVTLNLDNKLIVFANFNEGYATMTRKGTRLRRISGDTTQALRGSELFVLDGYMDGKILQPDAIKVMKFTTV